MPYQYPFRNADEKLKRSVWQKGRPIDGYDPKVWRRDACNHAMRYADHGDTSSNFGWEIDHIKPTSEGGSDDLDNLQPLYWENNRRKGDTYPWYCENAA
ncbi:HNH endonuclease signature motif containing protein [Pelagibius sp.]|uniref:HNH endonuclease signature motif containing protein n=1 Tax=Pelagibius sp. TaxID=1931238 RepID=UPI0026227DE1|nr:HNH endonuclease signature motif containing protein [Pelagibius sp.]